jgi:Tol biopolymer transport system component
MAEEPWLLALADAVSEGTPVDWDAARARATPEQAAVVEELFHISTVVGTQDGIAPGAVRNGRQGAAPGGAAGTTNGGAHATHVFPAAATMSPARSWGSLLVLQPIASGVYGNVHRAWDTHLDREVAVKFFRDDADGSAPLLREARALARVRHPNVVAVYGAEHEDGLAGLWMELVEGETLAHAVEARGPMSPREVAGIGIDVCRAVAALHAHNLVHRDIKAANVMRERGGRIVLMDFGVAHRVDDSRAADLQGTPAYMAPELFAGERASAAADVYAIGVLLFYLLTGRHPVEGDTAGELQVAHAREKRIRLRDARADLPDALARVVERATARREARFPTVGALEQALSGILGEAPGSRHGLPLPGFRRWRPASLAAAAVALAAVAAAAVLGTTLARAGWSGVEPAEPPPATAFTIGPHGNMMLEPEANDARVSPDGRWVVFSAWVKGTSLLFRRALQSTEITPIVGSEGGTRPFWSPDSRHVGFQASGVLKTIPIDGGEVTRLCDVRQFGGAAWSPAGVVLFSQMTTLWTVPATGGTPKSFSVPPGIGLDAIVVAPQVLGPTTFAYRVGFAGNATGVYRAGLDGSDMTRLFDVGPNVVLTATHAIFARETVLWSQRLDPATLTLLDKPVAVATEVLENVGQASLPSVSVSDTGVLVYRPRPAAPTRLAWFDLAGRELAALPAPAGCRNPEFSPDGQRVAVECTDVTTGRRDVYLLRDLEPPMRLTDAPSGASDAVWSPDGRSLAFSANLTGARDLFVRRWATPEAPRPLSTSTLTKYPASWSRDGARIAYTERSMGTGWNIWLLSVAGRETVALLQEADDEIEPQFSPDGRWLAFTSNRSGRWAVYLKNLMAPAVPPQMVSPGLGESDPRWSASGDALFFLTGDRRLVRVPARLDDEHPLGPPRELFATPIVGPIGLGVRFNYAVHPDGRRLLLVAGPTPREPAHLVVRTGWAPAAR